MLRLAFCPMAAAAAAVVALSLCPSTSAHAQEAGTIDRPPRLVQFVEADYPKDKHDAGITARVLLSIEISEQGKVGDVEVVESGGPDFDASAVAAVRRFVFEPAESEGRPTPVKITYRYDFTIKTKIVSTGPQINFDGEVLERFAKKPLANVEVALSDLGVSTYTDDDGRFAFLDVPPGPHKVVIRHPRLVTVQTEEIIRPAQKRTLKYFVENKEEDADEEVVVRAARIKKEAVETRIRTEEARRVPGTQGDTLKVVQNLPGVGRASFGSGQLVVWGSSPKETRVVVDGVEIPALYHMGGLRSTIHSDLVRSIDLSPGAYSAEYGRGLGGLVRIELAPLPTATGIHGSVAADVIDTSASLQAGITPRLRFAVAGRYSYLDRLLPQVTSADIGDFFPIPRSYDAQARAALALRKDEEVTATFLDSSDELRRTIPASDPADVRSQNNSLQSQRFFLSYRRLFDDGSSVRVTPSIGHESNGLEQSFGDQMTRLSSTTWQYGVRASLRRKLSPNVTALIGLDAQGRKTRLVRHGPINQPPREGDVVAFGQRPSSEVNDDTWTVNEISIAPYVTTDISLGRLTITPGLRFEPALIEGDHFRPRELDKPEAGYSRLSAPENPGGVPVLRSLPNPRVQVVYRATPRLNLTAGAGVYGQPPDPEDMSPVFGNPGIGFARAIHVTSGFSFKLRPTLTFETVGFYKTLSGLVSRSALRSPPVGQTLTQDGTGRVYGTQMLLRQELVRGFFGWITYSFSRSERRDHPGLAYRLFDQDQTHVLGMLASLDLGRGFEVGARFRYATGMPRTPVRGSFKVNFDGFYQPIPGAHNSERIPAFYQLDVRIEKGFVLGRTKASVFLDVQNVTNRRNPEELVYSADYQQKSTISGLPTLAVAGARLDF